MLHLPDKDYALKGRAATHIDELIRVARFDKYGADVDHKHENDIGEDGFNYFEANFRDYDGKYYRVPFSAAINENMETVYSIGKIRQRRFPANRGSSPETGALNSGRKPSEDIIYSSFDKSQEAKSAIKIAYVAQATVLRVNWHKNNRDLLCENSAPLWVWKRPPCGKSDPPSPGKRLPKGKKRPPGVVAFQN